MDGGEAAAADIAAARMGHRQRVADGDRRIDGVAARRQDVRAGLGGVALRTDRHAIGGFYRRGKFGGHIGAIEFGNLGIGGRRRGLGHPKCGRQQEGKTGKGAQNTAHRRFPLRFYKFHQT